MNEVQQIVQRLVKLGFSFSQIAEATDKRVSERTIRRYFHGEVEPRQSYNIEVLRSILEKAETPQ